MKGMKNSSLILVFVFTQTSFLQLMMALPSTSKAMVNCGHTPGFDTSNKPLDGSSPTAFQSHCGFGSSDAIDLSRNKDHSILINHNKDSQGVIEDNDFQIPIVKFGERKNKPHILKSSKGHIPPKVEPVSTSISHGYILPKLEPHEPASISPDHFLPRVEPYVPTSISPIHIQPKVEPEEPKPISPISNSNELSNKNDVSVPSSTESSLFTNDFNAGDLLTESHTPVREEAISEENLKSTSMIPPEQPQPDQMKNFIPSVPKPDSLLKEKSFIHTPIKPSVIEKLKDVVHHSKEIRTAHKDPAKPHQPSVIESVVHKVHHLKEKKDIHEEHQAKPHQTSVIESIVHKVHHLKEKKDINEEHHAKPHQPVVESILHKIHHLKEKKDISKEHQPQPHHNLTPSIEEKVHAVLDKVHHTVKM